MNNLNQIIRKRKTLILIMTYGYIIFNGCFAFPVLVTKTNMDFMLIGIMSEYIIIAYIFAILLKKKTLKIFLSTLFFTALGMVCGYILEYGEVSNTYYFTKKNIALYLTVIPLFVTIEYLIIPKLYASPN